MRSSLAAVLRSGRPLRRVLVVLAVLLGVGGSTTALALLAPDRGSLRGAAAPAPAPAPAAAVSAPLAAPGTIIPTPTLATPAPTAGAEKPPKRAPRDYYERTTTRRVAATATSFMPLYREAERTFGVSWLLVASVHRQETAFSTEPSTYKGLNPYGCCAGPMQFNVTNGPVTTWDGYKQSFRQGTRPASYPNETRKHPSVYDDFDAIMAAGALLRDGGATARLDGGSWSAAYAYYGRDFYGTRYASMVLARAQRWARSGFCLNCKDDPALVAALDDRFGVDARRVLIAAERAAGAAERKAKRARKARAAKARKARAERRARAAEASERRARPKAPARKRPATRKPPKPSRTTPAPSPAAPAPAAAADPTPTPSEPPPSGTTAPPAAAEPCTPLAAAMGCTP